MSIYLNEYFVRGGFKLPKFQSVFELIKILFLF